MLKTITDKSTIKEICDIVEKTGGYMENVRDRMVKLELSRYMEWVNVEAFDKDNHTIRYTSVGAAYLQQYLKD